MKKSKLNHHLLLRSGVWTTIVGGHWKTTGCPKSEVAAARKIRDERLGKDALSRARIKVPCAPLALGELVALYTKEEGRPYNRDKGGEQPGTKRSPDAIRTATKAIFRHLSRDLSAACVTKEELLDLAGKREREDPTPAPLSRRNTFAFLRRVYSWAMERPSRTGITRSPFSDLTKEQRNRLFPRGKKRAYVYSAEQLRRIYDRLPAHALPFVRFAVHTGMRLREVERLTWRNVHLGERRVYIEARFGKGRGAGKARDVALGEVACSILEALRPPEPDPSSNVFRGARGGPVDAHHVEEVFNRALLGTSRRAKKRKHEPLWTPANADEKKPRFHDLRKTAATRVEAASSHAVAKVFLGHADENVTDSYLQPSLDDVREAVNRAARSIDGEPPAGALQFPARNVAPVLAAASGVSA